MISDDPYITHAHCPLCGHETAIKIAPEWLMAHFTGLMGQTLSVLIEARRLGHTISLTELTRRVYARRSSQPKNPLNQIKNVISKNRKYLAEYGWWISGPMETLDGYRLVPLETHSQHSPFSRRRPVGGNGFGPPKG